MKVTAVVVTYQSARVIEDALSALEPGVAKGSLRVVIVDNGSQDDTLGLVRRDFPWAEVVEGHGNVGYGTGCNLGLARTQTPYVAFLNPDVVLPTDELARLTTFLDAHPSAAMVAPCLLEGDSPQAVGIGHAPLGALLRAIGLGAHGRQPTPVPPGCAPLRTDWLCGAALLGRTAVLRRHGGFDPRFFLYFEETDLCRRLIRAGHQLWAIGGAVARHVGGASARQARQDLVGGCIARHFYESRFYYWRKHWGWPVAAAADLGDLCLHALRLGLRALRGADTGGLRARVLRPVLRSPALTGRSQ